MAKTTTTKKASVDAFQKSIASLVVNNRVMFADCFDVFLDLALFSFCNSGTERQVTLAKYLHENEAFKKNYLEALNLFGDLSSDYHDALGDIFQEYVSHGQHGQFFTPESLSSLMSRIANIGKNTIGEKVYDPTCGSGRLLLVSLKQAREENGNDPFIYANDLSMTCAKMTLLNLLINSGRGLVTCGDALRNDMENFTFFYIDRLFNLNTGQRFSTYWQYDMKSREEIGKRRRDFLWMEAESGWTPDFTHTATEKRGETHEDDKLTDTEKITQNKGVLSDLPTEISFPKDDNGQFTLF